MTTFEDVKNRMESTLATAEGNTMTDTTTTTLPIPFTAVNFGNGRGITTSETNALILRNIIGNALTVAEKSDAYGAGCTLGWFVKTVDDAQSEMIVFREYGVESERERIRTALITYAKANGWANSEINDLLTALGMTTLSRTFEVEVHWSKGWGYSRPVAKFTFTTDDDTMDEDYIGDLIYQNIVFNESETEVDLDFTINARIGGTDVEEIGYATYALDTSELHENFSVSVTEV